LTPNFAFFWINDHRKWSDRNHFGVKSDERLRHRPSSAVYSSPSEWDETVEPKSNSKPPNRDLPEKLHFARDEAEKISDYWIRKESNDF
jgi:hypothetical protein